MVRSLYFASCPIWISLHSSVAEGDKGCAMSQVQSRERARSYVRKHFPSLRDVEPVLTTRRHGGAKLHVYTFKKKFAVQGGTLSRVVRIFVNAEGKIVKAVSSK